MLGLTVGSSVLPVFAATPVKTVTASAKLAYNLKGLNHNVAVQKAYIASKYLYVTQRSGVKTGKRLGETYRVDASGNSTHTVFRIQTVEGTVTWSIYDTVKLNRLLDSNEQVRMDSAAAKDACITSFTQSGSAIVRPNGSFQGADMLVNTELYTSGGAEGETPQIAMMSNTGTYKTLVKIAIVGTHEIEGVQTKNGNVYFTIVTDPVNKKNTQKVYYVPDSIF